MANFLGNKLPTFHIIDWLVDHWPFLINRYMGDVNNLMASTTYPLPMLRQPINTSSCWHPSNLGGVQHYLIYMDSNFQFKCPWKTKISYVDHLVYATFGIQTHQGYNCSPNWTYFWFNNINKTRRNSRFCIAINS